MRARCLCGLGRVWMETEEDVQVGESCRIAWERSEVECIDTAGIFGEKAGRHCLWRA